MSGGNKAKRKAKKKAKQRLRQQQQMKQKQASSGGVLEKIFDSVKGLFAGSNEPTEDDEMDSSDLEMSSASDG